MEEQVIKGDKKYTDCKENIHIKEEQKLPCYLQHHTTFIKKEIKAEELDQECICAESSMEFCDYSVVKNDENYETFYDGSLDIRNKSENISSFIDTRVQFQSFLCVLCNANLIDYEKLTTHIEYHLLHKCHICDYTSYAKGHLKRHIEGKHKQLKPHMCHICGYTTSQKGNLKIHIDLKHNLLKKLNVLKVHKCQICNYTTSYK